MATKKIKWLDRCEEHDFPAAESFLSLIMRPKHVRAAIRRLRVASVAQFTAKDVFRAARLPLLGADNTHVQRDLAKIKKDLPLSPLLLVRDEADARVIIADGYHRLCAVYVVDDDAIVPCQIV